MAMFVHLAPQSQAKSIFRTGIRYLREPWGPQPGGLFAMPVVRDFYITHQWLRELKRRQAGPVVGIYFRIPDDQPVWLGHYGQAHRQLRAAEAVGALAATDNALNWQVVIPRKIAASEIQRVRSLRQVIGWRYYPQAKGRQLICTCKYCIGGEYGAEKRRQRFGSAD